MYTPIHWLAYWNDVESINYILELVPNKKQYIIETMKPNIRNLSPLDVAGKHKSHESALLLLQFLRNHFNFVEDIFNVKNIGNHRHNKIEISKEEKN